MTEAEFELLIQSVGDLDDDIETILRLGERAYLVGFDGLDVEVELGADPRLLHATVELGAPKPEAAFKVYELLLTCAALPREQGGIGAALAGPGGALALAYTSATEELDARELTAIVTGLARRALALKAIAALDAAPSPEPSAAHDLTMIRI